jgi:predicted nucleic acid-binding protein
MDYVILDTDVCSYLFKRDTRAERYRAHLLGRPLCLCFQSVAELYQWAEINQWGPSRRVSLEQWLTRFVILPYDNETAQAWARVRAARRRQGLPISTGGAWIAACALRYDCTLVTHNTADFQHIDHSSSSQSREVYKKLSQSPLPLSSEGTFWFIGFPHAQTRPPGAPARSDSG